MDDLISERLGTVRLEPSGPVVAGSVGQWRLVYTVGSYGVDEGGTIKLAQRFASDWEAPQFDRPQEPGYTTVETDGEARLRPYYHAKAHVRPWMKCLVIDVYDGSLAPGDTVTITLGDRRFGSPGIRAQTFQESAHEFRLLVDPTNACRVERLPTSPVFAIVPGQPVSLVCTVPTWVVVGQDVPVAVRGQDRWGNPTPAPVGLSLSWQGRGRAALADGKLCFLEPGSGVVAARCDGDVPLAGCSNPVTASASPPALFKYWGDLHAQSDATVGTGSEEEYFIFARDVARLDFAGHQGNDFQVRDEDWQKLNDTVRAFQQDGRFVVFPGYEWSGNTTAGGDRNVIYRREGYPILRSSHWQVPGVPEDERTPAHPADVLFSKLKEYVGEENVLTAAHVGGRYADLKRYFDPALCPLVEILSCWGVFEWLLWEAFENDYLVGVICSSDGHKGRPGAEAPGAGEFGIAGGLTCVLAPTLERGAVFEALRQRRCYGTSGPRIDLDFEIDGQVMGSVVGWRDPVRVRAGATGAAPLESLALYRGREEIYTLLSPSFHDLSASRRLRVSWRGARIRGRGRRVTWDGSIRLEGCRILKAVPFAFDALTDGITACTETRVDFMSKTTGDRDGLDLWLDRLPEGRLVFDSAAASLDIDLAELDRIGGRITIDLGGVDMQVCVERYPEQLDERHLEFDCEIAPPPGKRIPFWVKAQQCDGHAAWSSPIYLQPAGDGRP